MEQSLQMKLAEVGKLQEEVTRCNAAREAAQAEAAVAVEQAKKESEMQRRCDEEAMEAVTAVDVQLEKVKVGRLQAPEHPCSEASSCWRACNITAPSRRLPDEPIAIAFVRSVLQSAVVWTAESLHVELIMKPPAKLLAV
jgi:hypothetical protein